MKIVQINTFSYKATGSIMMGIHELLLENGFDSYVVWGRGRDSKNEREIVIKDDIGMKFHGVYTRLTDRTGFASWRATKRLLQKLDDIKPDIIHLHNIHGYYVNIEMLFNYIRENNIKVVWTLHDCWALTGHCAWFDMCGCEKWKTGCHDCGQLDTYPVSKGLDNSFWNWNKKKELFTGLNVTIVTPSKWLADLVKKSFLKEYPAKVIYNGIDLNVFKPTSTDGLKEKYNLDDRDIVLGVASEWTPRKGLNDFIELSKQMEEVQFVVVGLSDAQMKKIPDTLKGIKRTSSQTELAGLYSLADIFFNPTYEDNFPTTNLEAMACGIPVITYDTGGSPESIALNDNGIYVGEVIKKINSREINFSVVENVLIDAIQKSKSFTNLEISSKATNFFSDKTRFAEYLSIYEEKNR